MNYKTILSNDLGVRSLSETCDHPLMWSHFANNGTGFCIEYKKDNNLADAIPITCSRKYPQVDLFQMNPIDCAKIILSFFK